MWRGSANLWTDRRRRYPRAQRYSNGTRQGAGPRTRPLPGRPRLTLTRLPARVGGPHWTAFIMSKIGRYIATTMPFAHRDHRDHHRGEDLGLVQRRGNRFTPGNRLA